MKCLLFIVLLLPIIFAAPDKRFLLTEVLQTVEQFAHSGMAHDGCVTECHKLVHGFLGSLCDSACTTALAAVP